MQTGNSEYSGFFNEIKNLQRPVFTLFPDLNQDGREDILYVNGDNADYSIVDKPYHGVRLFLNNGNNEFSEKYFHPMPGAFREIHLI
ncbi:MAG: VCBS repeat-containing protein [Phaeodactylibacter sp.]|nr:VCBS repeat-containing protein [Phaeodactylibacter sp.]